jgi:hypothetical protein
VNLVTGERVYLYVRSLAVSANLRGRERQRFDWRRQIDAQTISPRRAVPVRTLASA